MTGDTVQSGEVGGGGEKGAAHPGALKGLRLGISRRKGLTQFACLKGPRLQLQHGEGVGKGLGCGEAGGALWGRGLARGPGVWTQQKEPMFASCRAGSLEGRL